MDSTPLLFVVGTCPLRYAHKVPLPGEDRQTSESPGTILTSRPWQETIMASHDHADGQRQLQGLFTTASAASDVQTDRKFPPGDRCTE
jgi:hypothetical protein